MKQENKNSVLRFFQFKENPFGHGGEKRNSQVSAILKKHSLPYRQITPDWESYSALKKINHITKWPFKGTSTSHYSSCYNKIVEPGKALSFREKLLRESGNSKIFFWESTFPRDYFALGAARSAGLKVVALPHNLESLVPNPTPSNIRPGKAAHFNNEIKVLSQCDAVFTISHEETWLLKLFDINAHFLPYYPTSETLDYLKDIREVRKELPQEGYLIMGSAGNYPTQKGILELIETVGNSIQLETFKIAGFGTEQFRKSVQPYLNIQLLGELSNQQLFSEIASTKGVIIHQPPTTGMITRITELLIAGVPVICNYISARSYYGVEGIHIYQKKEDLRELVKAPLPVPPSPKSIEKWEKHFISILEELNK
ncbi:MAG: glycosyltransferase [Saprospiraceae bacterium]